MASSRDLVVCAAALVSTALACGSGPSKSEALEAVRDGTKTNGTCTLPIEVLSSLKVQYTTMGLCLPKENTGPRTAACLGALANAGIVKAAPESYMREWPDEVAARSLTELPAYERRARSLVFSACWIYPEAQLRQGQFWCAKLTPDKVTELTKVDDAHVDAKYTQTVETLDAIPRIEEACGGLTRPPSSASARLEKADRGWRVAPPGPGH